MADSLGPGNQRSTTWSVEDIRRRSLETPAGSSSIPSNRLATNGTTLDHDHDKPALVTPASSKSRSTLRQSRSMIVGSVRKAYPLPDPSLFENNNPTTTTTAIAAPAPSPASWDDPTHDILYPWQSFKRDAERAASKSLQVVTNPPSPTSTEKLQPEMGLKRPAPSLSTSNIHGGEKQPSSFCLGLKQPAPPLVNPVVKAQVLNSSSCRSSVENEPVTLRTLPEEVLASTGRPSLSQVDTTSQRKVVVVYDAESKKFSTAPVDVALKSYAIAEGDTIVVVAFLEHIMSPMGMKMVADQKQFSGVNDSVLKKAVLLKKRAIESTLRDTERLRWCELRKVQLDVKVLPGSNPKALVAKEIIDYQATYAIFDRNAMRNRGYYAENLSCRIFKLSNDGRRVEEISSFGQRVEKTSSMASNCSDSSSDSSMNSTDSPSLWSKLKQFGSKRSSSGPLRLSSGSVMGSSSRTSSNLGSPGEAEALEQSFSFDSPKPNPAAAYVYAAAGLDHEFG